MEDKSIIDLFWQRSEKAIEETEKKYGSYCYAISYRVLKNEADVQECVNDTYLRAWYAMPPKKPNNLRTFLGRIIRNLSLDKCQYYFAKKRKGDLIEIPLQELEECIAAGNSIEQELEIVELGREINKFLETLEKQQQIIFVQRYWYFFSNKEIAMKLKMSEKKVSYSLFQMRKKLKAYLEERGYQI